MPNWNTLLNEIEKVKSSSYPADIVRRKYLKKLHEKTGRNIIAYYSGWLRGPQNIDGLEINDMDMNGFMTSINNLDCSKGLDLILHTPGGDISATEQIVHYLRQKFGDDIRAVIPQLAMSAGTMLACSCKTIIMGKQSCLGPFDPHYGGVSAARVIREFDTAIQDIQKRPASLPLWQTIIGKYHPTFLDQCHTLLKRSENLVSQWLMTNMLKNDSNKDNKAKHILDYFTKTTGADEEHSRHISANEAQNEGLHIEFMEKDNELQDLILSVHHSFIHTFGMNPALDKAIENHLGIGMFNFSNK